MSRRRPAGYTLVEVMMGVALSAIGLVGIGAMQSASVRANQDAYESSIATNFARTWLERVKRDALLWNVPGNPIVGAMFASRGNPASNYFVPGTGWTAPRPLFRVATEIQESSGANYHGVEIGSVDPLSPPGSPVVEPKDIHYCLHLRFTTVQNDPAGVAAVAMAVDARVYWARKASADATQYDSMRPARDSTLGCDDPTAVYNDAQLLAATSCQLNGAANYCLRVHYLRTVVRMAP
jgi:prepilin-type N-terminal cleavage/methylation domain-containing protein